MLKFAVIIGSTRPGRVGPQVGQWAFSEAKKRSDAQFELVDLMDFDLPVLDEPVPAQAAKEYAHAHTRAWSDVISEFDGFVFVTPEYNHGMPASLKNALDFLYKEWNNKVAGIVSYGADNGVRSAESLRVTLATLQMAQIQQTVGLSLREDFEQMKTFKPRPHQSGALSKLLDQLVKWGEAMQAIRINDAAKLSPDASVQQH